MRILALPLLLAACSAPSDPQASDPQPTPAVATTAEPAASEAAAPAATADSRATPKLADLQTFKDWTVGCDNTRTCKAVALLPGDGFESRLLAAVERTGDGAVTVRITGTEAADRSGTLAVDGKAVAQGGTPGDGAIAFTGEPARRAAEALAAGRAATVAGAGPAAPLSLAGASAALRWMDAAQQFAGTSAAFVAKGDRAAATTAPAIPVVKAVKAVTGAGTPQPLPAADGAALRKQAGCDIGDYRDPPAGEMVALGDGATLLLVPCGAGAYNLMSAAFVRRGDTTEPARFDAETGLSPDPAPIPQPVNAEWRDGALTTFAKGRGIGDCGSRQRFVWDGASFRLVEQTVMGECRGSIDYITVWRAQVVR